jgi:MoaA/NifB/PqqE/SkfB family radical SAM enzyme
MATISSTEMKKKEPYLNFLYNKLRILRERSLPQILNYMKFKKALKSLPSKTNYTPLNIFVNYFNICNLRCVMCYRESTKFSDELNGKQIPLEDFKKIIRKNKAAISVTLSGSGEALLSPDTIERIAFCKKYKMNVTLNSNGVLLSRKVSRRLIKAGLHTLIVSIDSPNKKEFEKIRRGANFEQIMENIREFSKINERYGNPVDLQINSILFKDTFDNFNKLLNLLEHIGARKLSLLKLHEFPGLDLNMKKVNQKEFEKKRDTLLSMAKKKGIQVSMPTFKYKTKREKCIVPWTTIVVDADLRTRPCCLFKIDFPKYDLKKSALENWNNKAYITFRKNFKEDVFPQDCYTCELL